LTQQTDHQDLLTRLDAVTREIAPSLDHGLDAIGDPMALLLLPEQIAELRRRHSAAQAGIATSGCAR
jgi:hypothetical protein